MTNIFPDETPVTEVTYWYSRTDRAWIIQKRSAEGYQVDGAEYIGSGKADAVAEATELAQSLGVPVRQLVD